VDSFQASLQSLPNKNWDELSLGYSFLITSVIERLIDAMLAEPPLFGLEKNRLVERTFQKDFPFSEFPDRSDIGKVIRNLSSLYRELLSVRTISELREKIKPVQTTLIPVLVRWNDSFLFLSKSHNGFNRNKISSVFAEMLMRDYYHDIAYVSVALNHTFNRAKLYQPRFHELPIFIQSQSFFEGFKLGVSYLWNCLLGSEATKFSFVSALLNARSWNEFYDFYPAVNNFLKKEEEKLLTISFSAPRRPTFKSLAEIPRPKSGKSLTLMDRLDERFERFEVRIVSEMYTAKVATGLWEVILGALEFRNEDVRMIRFIHPERSGGNTYSYAVFIYAPIRMGDESEWWLFFDFCDDYSDRGESAFIPIEALIANNKRIHVTNFAINPMDLLRYVQTYPDFSKSIMDPLMRDFNNLSTLSGLRIMLATNEAELGATKGFMLELLATNLLMRMGYSTKWRFKKSFIGKEIDILALGTNQQKESEVIIVECSTILSLKLAHEVHEKVALVQSRLDEIKTIFGKELPTATRVKGWLVTSSFLKLGTVTIPEDVELLDWQKIIVLSNSINFEIPDGVREVLTAPHFDPSFILRPSSLISGITAPPAGEDEKPKGIQLVADRFVVPRKWSKLRLRKPARTGSHN